MAKRVLTAVSEITDKDFIAIPGLDPDKVKIPIESVTEENDGTWTVKDVYGVTINMPYPTSKMWIVKETAPILSTDPISVTADGQLFRRGDWLYWVYMGDYVQIVSIDDTNPEYKVISIRTSDGDIHGDLLSIELTVGKGARRI